MVGLLLAFAEMLWILLLIETVLLTRVLWLCADAVVEKGTITKGEWRRFVRGIGLSGTAFALMLGFLQYASGAMNLVCLHVQTSQAVQLAGYAIGIGIPAVFLIWLWLAGGAAYLAPFAQALSPKGRQYTARDVRLRLTSILVAMLVGGTLLQGKEPAGLTQACEVIQNTPSEMEQWKAFERLQAREL